MALECLFESGAGLGKRKDIGDFDFEGASVDEFCHLVELIAAGFDDEEEAARAVFCRLVRRNEFGDGNEYAVGAENLPGTRDGVATDGVEDEIDIVDYVFEIAFCCSR